MEQPTSSNGEIENSFDIFECVYLNLCLTFNSIK